MEKIIPPIIIVFGHPGSGKGTQAKRLVRKYRLLYFATGDMFRREAKRKSKFGEQIRTYLESGRLIPAGIVSKVAEQVLAQRRRGILQRGAIFDGYPRNTREAKDLEKLLDRLRVPNPVVVLNIRGNDRALTKRLLARGRPDDTPEVIKRRFEEYHTETEPTLAFLRERHVVVAINGNPPIPEVAASIEKILQPYLP